MTVATAQAQTSSSPLAFLRDLLLLSKPRLSTLVMLTSAGGMWLAPGRIGPARAILSVLATAIVSPDGESNWWKGCNCSPSMWSWSSRST